MLEKINFYVNHVKDNDFWHQRFQNIEDIYLLCLMVSNKIIIGMKKLQTIIIIGISIY